MNMIPINSSATMSSREIAELVEARHNDVIATIERLFAKGLLRSNRKTRHEGTGGRPIEVYDLIERDCYLVVSGYSDEVRARVVDRWQELEAQTSGAVPQVPKTYSQALRLAAEQAEQIEQQAARLEAQKPAVEFVGRYVEAGGSKGFREVCKLLSAKEPEFRAFLVDTSVLYQLGGRLVPYQQHIDAGRFEIKAGVTHDDHAYAFNQTRFTPKGIEWVAGKWMAFRINKKEITA